MSETGPVRLRSKPSLVPPQSQDNFYAQVHLTAAAQVVMSTNSGSQSFSGQAGINRFSYPLSVGSNIRVQVVGRTAVD